MGGLSAYNFERIKKERITKFIQASVENVTPFKKKRYVPFQVPAIKQDRDKGDDMNKRLLEE